MKNFKTPLIVVLGIFICSNSVTAQQSATTPVNEKHKKLAKPEETKIPATGLQLKKTEDPPAVDAKPIVPGGEFIPQSTADLPLPAGAPDYEKNPPQIKLPVQQALSPAIPVKDISTDTSKKNNAEAKPVKQQ